MSKMFCLLIFLILILQSCSSTKTLLSDLDIREFKYYKKGSSHLFTGTAFTNFDNGIVSSTIQIKDGVPNGKWVAYGYKGEIIQEGIYRPVDISGDNFLLEKKIERLNICLGKEGSYSSIDIYVIADTTELFIDTTNLNRYVRKVLREKNSLPGKDSINIKISRSELN